MAPNRARRIFVPTNPDLADIFGRMDLNFEISYVFHFLDPKFLEFQVPRFPKSTCIVSHDLQFVIPMS